MYSGSWRHHLFHTSLPPPPDGEHLLHKEEVYLVFFWGSFVAIPLTLKDLVLVGGEEGGQAPVFREESLSASRCHLSKDVFVNLYFLRRLEKLRISKYSPNNNCNYFC